MSRVVLRGLQYMDEQDLHKRALVIGERLKAGITRLIDRYPRVIKAVRGRGCMVGVEIADPFHKHPRLVRDSLIREGVIPEMESGTRGKHVPPELKHNRCMRFTPPATLSDHEVDQIIERYAKACERILANEPD